MCSIEENEVPIERQPRGKAEAGGVCMKCSDAKAVVLVRLNDPLCKACFLTYFTHKLRATIGKARVIRHEDRVLLAVSGGPSSLAMLKLVAHGYSDNAARKFRFVPSVVYIDEGAVLGLSQDERTKVKKEIQKFVVENGNFVFHEASLEDLFKDETHDTDTAFQKLQHCFNSVTSLTAKEDLLKSLRRQLLVKIASTTGNPKILVGDSASRIAVRLLSNVSQGRGEALSYDTGFIDSRHGDIMFLRPMREFVAKEISLYNFFNDIEAINLPTLATKSGCYASIDRLTEEFVSGLQAQLPSTVNTIFRTGDKLTEAKDLRDRCSLCGIPVEISVDSTTDKLDCLQLHQMSCHSEVKDSQPSNSGDSVSQSTCSDSGCSSEMKSIDNLGKTLCYGCSLTLKDMKQGFEMLPLFAQESAKKQLSQLEMKEQVQGFLLEN